MSLKWFNKIRSSVSAVRAARWLAAALVIAGMACTAGAFAANNSVQGAKKDDGGYDTDAPTAILIEAGSGSILFGKNPDELRPASSMMSLMTVEVVFRAIKQGEIKLTDQYLVSENAWRRGGAPAGGPTMLAALHSRIAVADLPRGSIVQNGNDASMILAEGIAGSERAFAEIMTKRARELGLTRSSFASASGLPDPGNRMTVRELAKLSRHT